MNNNVHYYRRESPHKCCEKRTHRPTAVSAARSSLKPSQLVRDGQSFLPLPLNFLHLSRSGRRWRADTLHPCRRTCRWRRGKVPPDSQVMGCFRWEFRTSREIRQGLLCLHTHWMLFVMVPCSSQGVSAPLLPEGVWTVWRIPGQRRRNTGGFLC